MRYLGRSAIFALFMALAFAVDAKPEITVGDIKKLNRYDERRNISRRERKQSEWILKVTAHKVNETAYVIVTDHTDPRYIRSLKKLATARAGQVRRVSHFRELSVKARYIALAPKDLTKELVVDCWRSIAAMDQDKQLDAYPSFLVAPDFKSFDQLIEASIHYKAPREIKIAGIGNYLGETRSYEKILMLHKQFGARFSSIVTSDKKLPRRPNIWVERVKPRQPAAKISHPEALESAKILLTFGHGKPKALCGYQVKAFEKINFKRKFVMSGSCFSGVQFAQQSIKNGAIGVYCHLSLNSGFPTLYPSLESLLAGKSLGQVQQELINAQMKMHGPIKQGDDSQRRSPNNHVLYVIIGDPSLKPFRRVF
jgi:hypothetical protein